MVRLIVERTKMPLQNRPGSETKPDHAPAVEHISGARELLHALRKRIGEHPELGEAITKLEVALSLLTVKTGGML
jgi:hypothetical protein